MNLVVFCDGYQFTIHGTKSNHSCHKKSGGGIFECALNSQAVPASRYGHTGYPVTGYLASLVLVGASQHDIPGNFTNKNKFTDSKTDSAE